MKNFKKLLAIVLVISMVLSFAACGNPTPEKSSDDSVNSTPVGLHEDENGNIDGDIDLDDLALEDPETIINILDPDIDTSKLSDKELEDTAHDLLDGINKVDDDSSIDVNENKDAYDENGAMTKPFDEVYPEAIEDEIVEYSDETILVKMSNSKNGRITLGMFAAGVAKLDAIVPLENETWYKASLRKGTDTQEALEEVRELKEVILAEYDYKIKTTALDEYKELDSALCLDGNKKLKDQWYLNHCGIPDSFKYIKNLGGSSNVIVAVIDSGVDIDHEDLAHNIWKNTKEKPDNGIDDDGNGYIDDYYGVNIISGKGNGDDDNGHGTHVAGIIAAQNNNLGTVGIAYKTTIMPIKAAASSGYLLQSDIAKAVLYAYENGAEVINMSFGGTSCSIAVQDALATAYTRCVLVASAGNSGAPNEGFFALPNYPAALTYVLGVMAVDRYGRETSFTNWDYKAYNGFEYELYAPGYSIMSTLPNDKYGSLSGTSMAAPVVSAMAAILRSEFADRDTYPTKFIYGQLASTSEISADCLDPRAHGLHNIPQIANLYSALTKLPKPAVGMQDFLAFDTEGLTEDTDNVNNGDGVIDAGETISLGLILRNRWGMSKDTYVTLDTETGAGLTDPYITFVNPTVNYNSVGTYSTQDCGKIYTDELHTGWENPFIIKIAKDCPNDYIVKVNVRLSYKNGLDENDKATYTSLGSFILTIRNGVVLPSIIEEDMTLTPDNLYIIPNSTVITEDATVTVQPGTNIQFWSDDPQDPYAATYIASLKVDGSFLVEGTKENPVNIFPSDLMSNYNVELYEGEKGYISLKYAEATNLASRNYKTISCADHCTFRFNYGTKLYFRELRSGKVNEVSTNSIGGCVLPKFTLAKDSVFYKLGLSTMLYLSGNAQRCIFADCGIKFNSDFTAQNCVFLGNTFLDQTNPNEIKNSSMQITDATVLEKLDDYDFSFYYRKDTGTTYVLCTTSLDLQKAKALAKGIHKALGGNFAKFETVEEFELILNKTSMIPNDHIHLGIQKDKNGKFLWYDGTPVAQDLLADPSAKATNYNYFYNGKIYGSNQDWYCPALFEIPGKILPTEITFREYAVNIDKDTTYQITPLNTPIQLDTDAFIYEVTDENVVTVSETGLVTPVGNGTTEVFVYFEDRAVYNYITFTVSDYVPLEDFEFYCDADVVGVGESLVPSVAFTPANTTRKNVTYASSDPSVIKVDPYSGIATGISSGTATITATCEGISHTFELKSILKATSVEFKNISMSLSLAEGEKSLPEVITNEGAETSLSWRSVDETVVKIENGKLVPLAAGSSTLVVTDKNTGLSASCLVFVGEKELSPVKKTEKSDYCNFILLENGDLYYWDIGSKRIPEKIETSVVDFSFPKDNSNFCYFYTLHADGSINIWQTQVVYSKESTNLYKYDSINYFEGRNDIKSIAASNNSSYFITTTAGNVYAWGNNEYGQLGVGGTSSVNEPTLVNIDNVVDVKAFYEKTVYLTSDGNIYYSGNGKTTPTLLATKAEKLLAVSSNTVVYLNSSNEIINIYYTSEILTTTKLNIVFDFVSYSGYDNYYYGIGIKDGEIYYINENSGKTTHIPGIDNALYAYSNNHTHYIVTTDGQLFGYGANSQSNPFMGITTDNELSVPAFIPLECVEEDAIVTSHEQQGNKYKLTFNKQINDISPTLYADGTQVTANYEINNFNELVIWRTNGFSEGVEYKIILEAGKVKCPAGVKNSEDITVNFTHTETPETSETPEEKVVHESITDSTIERYLNEASFINKLKDFQEKNQFNPKFFGNAMLNRLSTDTTVDHWLRFLASDNAGQEIPLGGNWWGTTNKEAIGLQLVDYSDYITYGRFMYEPYLTSAPENTFPFVTSVKVLNNKGEEVTTVGNEQITVQVTFNRDMDTSIPLQVRFGSAYPYGDYEIEGKYVDARTWEGKYKLTTIIENGIQYFTIENGCSATEDLQLMRDRARFAFEIDTTAAQALIMQGEATDTGIHLSWTQDDFDTLMGYNVYRSTSEDGLYVRVNSTVIPADTMEFFDDTVEPGVLYYYNFTVVQTDLSESDPSGKITIMSKDTMAPNIYHSPVYNATTGSNLVISATVTDNLNITYARVYYRIKGEDEWRVAVMNRLNDKYSAIIIADHITVEGLEYYIEAFDGVSYTYKGSAETPYFIAVQEVVSKDAMGDVNGDGAITNLDALMLLKAINDQLNLTPEQFARADLNGDGVLVAKEALCILQYVSGAIGYVDMREEANA